MGAVPLRGRPHHRQDVREELRRVWIPNPVAVGVMLAMKDRVGARREVRGALHEKSEHMKHALGAWGQREHTV